MENWKDEQLNTLENAVAKYFRIMNASKRESLTDKHVQHNIIEFIKKQPRRHSIHRMARKNLLRRSTCHTRRIVARGTKLHKHNARPADHGPRVTGKTPYVYIGAEKKNKVFCPRGRNRCNGVTLVN